MPVRITRNAAASIRESTPPHATMSSRTSVVAMTTRTSRRTRELRQATGVINAAVPRTAPVLKMLLPTALPMATPGRSRAEATALTTSSGADVP